MAIVAQNPGIAAVLRVGDPLKVLMSDASQLCAYAYRTTYDICVAIDSFAASKLPDVYPSVKGVAQSMASIIMQNIGLDVVYQIWKGKPLNRDLLIKAIKDNINEKALMNALRTSLVAQKISELELVQKCLDYLDNKTKSCPTVNQVYNAWFAKIFSRTVINILVTKGALKAIDGLSYELKQ